MTGGAAAGRRDRPWAASPARALRPSPSAAPTPQTPQKDPRVERLPCSHKGTYADDCICERVGQHKCYIVATCDRDLRRRIRKVGVAAAAAAAARACFCSSALLSLWCFFGGSALGAAREWRLVCSRARAWLCCSLVTPAGRLSACTALRPFGAALFILTHWLRTVIKKNFARPARALTINARAKRGCNR